MSQPTKPAPGGRRTIARHGRLRSPHPVSQLVKLLAVGLAVVLASGVGVAAYAAIDLSSTFSANAVELEGQSAAPPDLGAIEGGVNLFLAGTDACEPQYAALFGARCTGADAGDELNDVNMLIHISDNPRRVTVISFPRDLIIPTPECTKANGSVASATSASMLNATYSYGGLSCVVKTVSELTGLNIPFAAKVTWGGVIQVTNAIGGVTVCIANGIKDRYTGLNLPAGNVTISGLEALQFLRTRHGVGDGGDLGRISNQQQYMSRLAQKLVGEGVLSNPTTLYKLATTAVKNVTPSESLTNPLTLVQIALAVKSVPFDQIVFVQYPTVPDPSNPNRVIPNQYAASALLDVLAKNEKIQLTGQASQGNGVVVVTPSPTPSATSTPGSTAGSTATPTPTPTDTAVALPSSIAGQTAAEQTCSNGNVGRK
ncbi:LCP family protein [Microbacterium sp.]|uniref:LCP family protein n=1 Tax=Microbacterium sp. TaxID=51671 RepID=UPI001ACF3B59|nr:LCP family protein [Microbacterium sp.]MBN9193730.1 LCP family protein [Microbacterium sp.]